MNDASGYAQRIREALTLRNIVLFVFGVLVGCAAFYGATHY